MYDVAKSSPVQGYADLCGLVTTRRNERTCTTHTQRKTTKITENVIENASSGSEGNRPVQRRSMGRRIPWRECQHLVVVPWSFCAVLRWMECGETRANDYQLI